MVTESITDKSKNVLDPILAIGWGKTIQLVQVLVSAKHMSATSSASSAQAKLEFVPFGKYEVDSPVMALHWLGSQV